MATAALLAAAEVPTLAPAFSAALQSMLATAAALLEAAEVCNTRPLQAIEAQAKFEAQATFEAAAVETARMDQALSEDLVVASGIVRARG